MATTGEQKPIRTNYEIFILTLSLLSIVNLLIALLPIDQDVKNLVVHHRCGAYSDISV